MTSNSVVVRSKASAHTVDRLNGRWDRFSWFGIYAVAESGALDLNNDQTFGIPMLIATMEALLIEGLEPPQNRKGEIAFVQQSSCKYQTLNQKAKDARRFRRV